MKPGGRPSWYIYRMSLLFGYVLRYRRTLVLALGLAAVNQIFSLLDPQIFRLLIDSYASRIASLTPSEFLSGVGLLLFLSIGVAFVSRLAKNFQDYYVNVIVQRVGASLYERGVSHSFSLPYAAFEDQRSGELLRKLDKARSDAQALITSSVNILFFSLVGIVFVLIYAFWVHWWIGLAYFLIIPVLGTTTLLVSRRIKAAQRRIVAQTAELAGSTTETLRNVELVKSLGLDRQETERLNQVNEAVLRLELEKVKTVRKLAFLQGTMINLLRSAILFLMLWLIFRGDISLGEFFSILFYSFFLFNPLAELGTVATSYQEARASGEALQEILGTPPEPRPENPVRIGPLGSLRFDSVSFEYAGGGEALRKIDLNIKKGETIAFVGPSGSGKTTLVKLILGLYRPTRGGLLLNGTDAGQADWSDFRSRIGYVSQETQLFAGTIRENLLFVNSEASDEECLAVLAQAEASAIIERGGRGLDTKIGEGGIKLSGGERQRLAIARALLRRPELLIFDEATSSLDSLTERSITRTIRTVTAERPDLIIILIAHRLSTVAHADRIYVLAKGKVVEEGGHAELLAESGLYAALWREQSAAEGVAEPAPA